MRKKKDISPDTKILELGLKNLNKIRPVSFKLNSSLSAIHLPAPVPYTVLSLLYAMCKLSTVILKILIHIELKGFKQVLMMHTVLALYTSQSTCTLQAKK